MLGFGLGAVWLQANKWIFNVVRGLPVVWSQAINRDILVRYIDYLCMYNYVTLNVRGTSYLGLTRSI